MIKRKLLLKVLAIVFFLLPFLVHSQSVPIGQWRDHTSYRSAVAVALAGNRVYCATRSNLFYFNKGDNSINRLTKINGLSDISIRAIKYHENTNTLVIAYENSNIDLLVNNRIVNIPDLFRKNIPGRKNINRITFDGNFAYLSTGFGIIQLDLMRHEIRSTFHIGPEGAHIEVFNLAQNDTHFMAATEMGVFWAEKNAPNLASFDYWEQDTTLSNKKYKDIAYFAGRLFVNKAGQGNHGDTLMYFENDKWHLMDTDLNPKIHAINISNGRLSICYDYYVKTYNENLDMVRGVWNYEGSYAQPRYALTDEHGVIWIADNRFGLIFYEWEQSNKAILPDGPRTNNVYKMHVSDGQLSVAPGLRHSSTWANLWNQDGIFLLENNRWRSINARNIPALDSIHDIVNVITDPRDKNRLFAASWRRGLLEFYDDQLVNIYTDLNSPLASAPTSYWIGVSGLAFDNQNNLWVTNSNVSNALSVMKPDGKWLTFEFPEHVNQDVVGDVVIDHFNQKWAVIGRGRGILVFNHNNTLEYTADDQAKRLTTAVGNGYLPSNLVTALAVDRNGEVWVGTDKGIAVFYSPGNVFSGNSFDAQQILVELGGYYQYLLESQTITAIAVDGANRKWIGTASSGVFLVSSDGTQQLLHFNESNSPLFSDIINDIAIDHQTGEVYFGTAKGIVSYKGTATAGNDSFQDVYAYPNPVRPDYNGFIAVKGLLTDVDVKITDVSGNLVYSTISQGGQAIWNGRNMNGQRVASGVYLVFCSNDDGSETYVTKILFLN